MPYNEEMYYFHHDSRFISYFSFTFVKIIYKAKLTVFITFLLLSVQ